MEMSRLMRDGTAEPVSRDQTLRLERGQEEIIFPVQLTKSRIDWQPYLPVDPYSCYMMCDHTHIHTYIHTVNICYYYYNNYCTSIRAS